jgi:predicted ester cyclase
MKHGIPTEGAVGDQCGRAAADIAVEFLAAIDSRDIERIPDFYAEGARIEDPGGAIFAGGVELKSHINNLVRAFPDIKHHVANVISSTDSATVQGLITGTHQGPLVLPERTIPASGKRIEVRFAFVIHTARGKIIRDDLYFDRMEMLGPLEEQ